MAVKGKVALCNGVRGLNGGSTADVKNAVLVALCNGVRGLKYHWEPDEVEPIIVALCNGVRGLKSLSRWRSTRAGSRRTL